MRRSIVAIIMVLFCTALLSINTIYVNAAGNNKTEYADQSKFLDTVSSGIAERIANTKKNEVVDYSSEYSAVSEYIGQSFKDEVFGRIADAYLSSLKILTTADEPSKDTSVSDPLSSAGLLMYCASVCEMHDSYGLEIDEGIIHQYKRFVNSGASSVKNESKTLFYATVV